MWAAKRGEAVAQYTAVLSACRLQFKKGTFKRLRFWGFVFFVFFLHSCLFFGTQTCAADCRRWLRSGCISKKKKRTLLAHLLFVLLSNLWLFHQNVSPVTHTHVHKQHTLILTCQPGGPASNTSDGWHEMVAWKKKTTTSPIQIYDMGCWNWAPFLHFLSPQPLGTRWGLRCEKEATKWPPTVLTS